MSDLYLHSLIITVICEVLVTLAVTKKGSNALIAVIINLITHPWAYFFFFHKIPLLPIELLVVVIECAAWVSLTDMRLKKSLVIAVAANIFSYLIGSIIFNMSSWYV